MKKKYNWVYILTCGDGSIELSMCWKVFGTRGDAIKVEIFIKKGRRKFKKRLINSPQMLKDIFYDKTGYELKILPYEDIEKVERETKIVVDRINESK